MPTARPFAFNSGATISGTEQIGQIAIGTTPQNYSGGYGGVRWWNGPDEDLGYVICYSVPTLDHPSPDGNIAGVGFFRSKLLTEESFITIATYVSDYTQFFTTGNEAKTWLNANGYWTSWESPPNGVLRRSSGTFDTYTGATIITFSSSTFNISGDSYLPVFDGETKSFTHGGIEVNDTVTIGVSGTPYFLVALTKNSTTFSQNGLWYTSESGFTINTAISTGDTFTVSVSVPVREYENSGTGNSAIEACSAYPSASTSKYSVLPWTNWGSDTYIFNDSQFTSPFTSAYIANVESGGSDILWKQTDSNGKVINQGNCPTYSLLADLDASNSSSYPGTGTEWFDLTSNNNDGTLNVGTGTITYGTTNGGEFTLNGGTNTRIEFTDNSDISLSTTTTKTYIVWINASRVGFVSFSDTVMSKQSGNPAGDGFWVGINSSNQLVGRVTSDGGSTNKFISGIGATISTGTWYMISLVVKVSSDPDTFKMFINTTEVGSTNGGGSSVNDTNDLYLGNFHIGLQNARSFQGKIGDFYVYEGNFTSSDVTAVFNETKSRFGY